MALTAALNLAVTPNTLTVTSDRRVVSVNVTVLGETVTAKANFPITVVDARGVVWNVKSDTGLVAVYNPAV